MDKITAIIKKIFGGSKPSDSSLGFTLIELLVVIAVIGILAAAVLIAIDPIEQLARGRDSGRKQSVAQIGRAVQSYYTANLVFPAPKGTETAATCTAATCRWDYALTKSGELKLFPSNPPVTAPACDSGTRINQFCYESDGTNFIISTRLQSKTERNKGTCGNSSANTYYVYSSAAGKAGTYCSATDPAVGINQASLLN